MYTIDASVWVNSFDSREPEHVHSRQTLDILRRERIPIFLPTLVLVEVAGAVSRTRHEPQMARDLAIALGRLPSVVFVPLDESLAQEAVALAAAHGLRGADAVYVAVAARMGCRLVTLDREQLARTGGIVVTETPEAALSSLASPADTL
jgi:predicted nucleic acid-binding protein